MLSTIECVTLYMYFTDVPSSPGMPTVTDIQSRTCRVSWQTSKKDNNSPIIGYLVQVKE